MAWPISQHNATYSATRNAEPLGHLGHEPDRAVSFCVDILHVGLLSLRLPNH